MIKDIHVLPKCSCYPHSKQYNRLEMGNLNQWESSFYSYFSIIRLLYKIGFQEQDLLSTLLVSHV